MSSLYHMVPKNMSGTVLYPLNQFRERMPEVYAAHVAKYAGREAVMAQRIPNLDCLWNDALHFTAVDPVVIREALREAGAQEGVSWKFYRNRRMIVKGERLLLFHCVPHILYKGSLDVTNIPVVEIGLA